MAVVNEERVLNAFEILLQCIEESIQNHPGKMEEILLNVDLIARRSFKESRLFHGHMVLVISPKTLPRYL